MLKRLLIKGGGAFPCLVWVAENWSDSVNEHRRPDFVGKLCYVSFLTSMASINMNAVYLREKNKFIETAFLKISARS